MVRESRCVERPPGFVFKKGYCLFLFLMRPSLMVFIWCVLAACGSKPKKAEQATNMTDAREFATMMAFERHSIADSASRVTAFTCLLPQGWEIMQWSRWIESDVTSPFKFRLAAVDTADSLSRIDFYPTLAFITSSEGPATVEAKKDPLAPGFTPVLPSTALDAIRAVVIPMFRPGLSDMRVVEQVPLSNVAPLDSAGKEPPRETGLVRIKYMVGNDLVEEAFFAVLRKQFATADGYNAVCYWHVEHIVSCRAREGYMDEQLKRLLTAITSLTYDQNWIQRYNATLMRLGANTEETVPSINSNNQTSVFLHHQQNIYRVSRAYAHYQPSLEYYVDKNGDLVALPAGFIIAWGSDAGIYALADMATYRMQDSNIVWYEIKRNGSRQESDVYNTKGALDDPLSEQPL